MIGLARQLGTPFLARDVLFWFREEPLPARPRRLSLFRDKLTADLAGGETRRVEVQVEVART
jgi:hypothetical protein